MTEQFKIVVEQIIREGFPQLADTQTASGKPLDFRISPYSLNTKLSFKFDSLDHFIEFLKLHETDDLASKTAALQTALNELAIDASSFFYVNFFEDDVPRES